MTVLRRFSRARRWVGYAVLFALVVVIVVHGRAVLANLDDESASAAHRTGKAVALAPPGSDVPTPSGATAVPREGPTFSALGDAALAALDETYYVAPGGWRDCPLSICVTRNHDWGSDALTYVLALRQRLHPDVANTVKLAALAHTERLYLPPCDGRSCTLWSDVPMWDSIAASREASALPSDPEPASKAARAFWAIEGSNVYDRGACPSIRYQRPFGRGDKLKTLETDSNGVKAALLLYEATHQPRYLVVARTRYAAIRRWFLDPTLPLYSVYVFDDGKHCRQVPHRYFASVNGNMIWDGLHLARATGETRYRDEARETAFAVENELNDPRGIFADLQAENDIEEPLIEAMNELAQIDRSADARAWILRNAAVAYGARREDGAYGRFFDGPRPVATVTAWQTNGGLALEVAAAGLAPDDRAATSAWTGARYVRDNASGFPTHVRFRGSGIALLGTIGDRCCQPGHARIFVDGIETTSRIGTWQNKSSSGRRFPGSVLFAWRWPTAGEHDVALYPGGYNAKEGGGFLHLAGYLVK